MKPLRRIPWLRLGGMFLLAGPGFVFLSRLTEVDWLSVAYLALAALSLVLGAFLFGVAFMVPTKKRLRQIPVVVLLVVLTLGALLLALEDDYTLFLAVFVGAGLTVALAWYQETGPGRSAHPRQSPTSGAPAVGKPRAPRRQRSR